jgi:hypothetical protein
MKSPKNLAKNGENLKTIAENRSPSAFLLKKMRKVQDRWHHKSGIASNRFWKITVYQIFATFSAVQVMF